MKFSKIDHHKVSNNNHKRFSSISSLQFKKEGHKANTKTGFNKISVSSPQLSKVLEIYDNKLKIFIKNIPNDGDAVKSQIQQLLLPCGEILHERYFTRRRGSHTIHTALIVFKSEAAVKKALEVHGSVVEGHHIIVSTNAQYNANTNGVRIKNLPWDATEEDLWNVFETVGKILFINISNPINLNDSDEPLEGEIIFETEEEAKEALYFDNTDINGHLLDISRISPKNKNHADYAVYVSGLPQDVTKEKVIQFFDKCGVVRMVKLNFKHLSAVIHFTSDDAVKAAIQQDGKSFGDSRISVYQRKGEVFNLDLENPVYIYNIPESVRDVDIFLAFQDCGYIIEVRFLQRRTSSKKRAVIQFKYPDSVVKALELNGLELRGEPVCVTNSKDCLSSESTSTQQSEVNGNGTCSSRLKSKKEKRKDSTERDESVGKKKSKAK